MTIKEMRLKTKLSQSAFGRLLYNIPLRTVQNWEYNVTECPPYVLKLIEYKLTKDKLL
jgi:DNA-binding transcriptional regulator YiaG